MQHGAHRAVRAAPVRQGIALEAPVATQDFVQKMLILRTIVAVDLVVGGHHAHRPALAHGALEGLEVDLPQRPFVHLGVHAAAVGLLVVDGEMLDAGRRAPVLQALRVAHRQCSAEGGVLAQVFVGTAAHGQALDVDGRAENDVLAAQAGFDAHARAVVIGQVLGPGRREGGTRREIGGGIELPARGLEAVGHALFADAEGAVGIVHVRNAEALHAGRRHVGLAVQHIDLFLEGHLRDDGIDFRFVRQEAVLRRDRPRASRRHQPCGGQQKQSFTHII